jgi:hypothetical protein
MASPALSVKDGLESGGSLLLELSEVDAARQRFHELDLAGERRFSRLAPVSSLETSRSEHRVT